MALLRGRFLWLLWCIWLCLGMELVYHWNGWRLFNEHIDVRLRPVFMPAPRLYWPSRIYGPPFYIYAPSRIYGPLSCVYEPPWCVYALVPYL